MPLRRFSILIFACLALLVFMAAQSACVGSSGGGSDDEDDEEEYTETPTLTDELEVITGYPWNLEEGDVGAQSPRGWNFLFAINLSQEYSQLLDGDWAVDFDEVEDRMAIVGSSLKKEGLDLTKIDHQIIMVKVQNIEGEIRLRFAAKLTFDGDIMAVDTESAGLLGETAGSLGTGWYAAYYSDAQNAFVTGSAAPCGGVDVSDILITADSGFYTRPTSGGQFTLPAAQQDDIYLTGRPLTLFFQSDECMGALTYAVTDTALYPNLKCEIEGVPEDCDTDENVAFSDGTVVTAQQFVNLAEDGFEIPAADADCANCDFETGDTTGWQYLAAGGAETSQGCFGVSDAAYADLFPDGDGSRYAWITTGGEGLQSCAVYRTLTAPENVSKLIISYDFATQEYPDYAASAYSDIFTVYILGEYEPLIERGVADQALIQDFVDMPEDAQAIAGVAESADASYAPGGAVFGAHLSYDSSGDTPRGSYANGNLGRYVSWPVVPGEEITLVLLVSDAGDAYWDSAALIDSVSFE